MMTLPIFGLEWHIRQSPAVRQLVIDPLKDYLQFEQIPWDGVHFPFMHPKQIEGPLLFFQFPPSREVLEKEEKIVWIPMWDHARGFSSTWWKSLPKKVRVVAFSEQIRSRARAAGLQTLPLRFFIDPMGFSPIDWNDHRVLFYWNRVGLMGPETLDGLCKALHVEKLIYFNRIDPLISKSLDYSLPKQLGNTQVMEITAETLLSHAEYKNLISQAGIFIAPRRWEGVGLTMLEALAQGSAVFGVDSPTMNEYIRHKVNGYLFPLHLSFRINNKLRRIKNHIRKLLPRTGVLDPEFVLHPKQNWREISALDLPKIGSQARRDQQAGYAAWLASIEVYSRFLMEW